MRNRKSSNQCNAIRFVGKFPSLKLDKMVLWRTQLERDLLYLLEFDVDVISYRAQPFSIDYVCNGTLHYCIPAFLVERTNKSQVVEVKLEEQLKKGAEDYRSVAAVCSREGYEFLVFTESTIRSQPRLDNIKQLWRYARTELTLQHQLLCRDFIRGKRQATFDELIHFFESRHVPRQVVYALAYHGVIRIDLMQPIKPEAVLWLPEDSLAFGKVS